MLNITRTPLLAYAFASMLLFVALPVNAEEIEPATIVDELAELDPSTGDVQTRCDLALTICATSTAVSSPVCTSVAWHTAQCTGAATVGGIGTSPAKLPGRVDWSGSGSASASNGNSCSGSYRSATGSSTWAGLTGASGAGSPKTLSLCTQVYFFTFGGCLSISVRSDADATAKTTPGGVTLTSVSAPHAGETKSGSKCV